MCIYVHMWEHVFIFPFTCIKNTGEQNKLREKKQERETDRKTERERQREKEREKKRHTHTHRNDKNENEDDKNEASMSPEYRNTKRITFLIQFACLMAVWTTDRWTRHKNLFLTQTHKSTTMTIMKNTEH